MLIFVLSLILIPLIATQASELIMCIPQYISSLQQLVIGVETNLLSDWVSNQIDVVKENFSKLLTEGAGFIGVLLTQILNSGKSLVDVVSLLVVTPVVAFYRRLNWGRMIDKVNSWIPCNYAHTFRQIAHDMDKAIAGFVRGQGVLCLILGVYYAVYLSLIGLFSGLISCTSYSLNSYDRPHSRGGCRHRAVLARLYLRRPDARRVLFWLVHRRQHPAAAARRQQHWPVSHVADIRIIRFRRAVRFR